MEDGDLEGMASEMAAATNLAEDLRQSRYIWYSAMWKALLALFNGRFPEAAALITEAHTLGAQAEDPNAYLGYSVQSFILSWNQGRLEEFVERVDHLIEEYPKLLGWRCVRALIYAETGRLEAARAEFDIVVKEPTRIPRDLFLALNVSLLAEVAARLNDDRTDDLYDLLSPFDGRFVTIGVVPSASIGSTSRYLGLLATTAGRFEQAQAHFRKALYAHSTASAWPWLAHTQHDYSQMLLRRAQPKDRAHATHLLLDALKTSDALGMSSLSHQVEETLRAIGLYPRRENQ
jgi:tetratricopeptide (TPR) repeat protein